MTKPLFFSAAIVMIAGLVSNESNAQVAGHAPKFNWKNDSPFEQKVFIENKGQWNGKDELPKSEILYGIDNLGTNIYFTKKGLTHRVEEITITPDEMEGEELRKAAGLFGKREKEEFDIKVKKSLVSMEWVGADPAVKMVADEMVPDYYSYNMDGTLKNAVSKARAYKKLTYYNLYPGIDVEYIFHAKEGIKYTLIVHPGADPSQVKMRYRSRDAISVDAKGNLHFKTKFGDIVDHAPVTFYENSKAGISSAFVLNGSEVSFQLGAYDKSKTLIIDPWTIDPAMTSTNRVFDVEPDAFGNVYAYGGASPWKLKKFNSLGVLQWTFNNPNSPMYGDMDVVMGTGITYLTTGLQGTITKVWTNGTMAWNQTTICNYEYWTVNANCAGNRVVVTASFSSSNTSGLADIDTTTGACSGLVNFTITGGNPDFRASVWAPNQNFYLLQTRGNQVNELWGRTNTFTPLYSLLAGWTSPYNGTPVYRVSFIQPYNGMDANLTNFFVTSGASIYKHNIATGANISSVVIPGGGLMACNGVAADGCNQIYVGSTNGVYKFDSSLVQLSSQPTNAVYDVTLGALGEVLIGGDQLLGSLNFSACPASQGATLTVTASSSDATCGNNNGSVTASASGGTGAYTYTWTPSGQTGQTATGLSAGTYTVNIKDATGCNAGTQTVTIAGGGLLLTAQSANILCNGQLTGTASVTSSGGQGSYTYSWNPGGQTSQSLTGLSAGSYTVTATDSLGCSRTQAFTITEPTALAIVDSTVNILCNGVGAGSSTGLTSGGTGAYTYTWSNGQTGQTATGLTAGTYTMVVADANGCTKSKVVTVTQPTPLVLNATGVNINCTDDTVTTASANASGGVGPYTYSWSNGATTANITGILAGSYTVMITDANGCTKLQVVNVTIMTKPKASISATPTSGQVPLNVIFTNSSTGGVSYSWNFGDGNSSTSMNSSNTYVSGGNYTVMMVVTAANGCKDTAYITIFADGFSEIIVPNVFSPNGDGYNEFFSINSIGLKDLYVEIYDRWGLKMGDFNTITGGWDGKAASGKDAPEGTYYYILLAHGSDNKEYNLKGYLMLLRK